MGTPAAVRVLESAPHILVKAPDLRVDGLCPQRLPSWDEEIPRADRRPD
jgi:hypothetical protein